MAKITLRLPDGAQTVDVPDGATVRVDEIVRGVTPVARKPASRSITPEIDSSPPDENSEFCSLADLEKRHIATVLQRCNGKVREAAGILGIGRTTLYEKMTKYDLSV